MFFVALMILLLGPNYGDEIGSVLLHPIFHPFYTCTEHWAKQFQGLGDALGTDCHIQKFETKNGRSWLRSYKGEGLTNEDWYTWHQPVMSPITGIVSAVNINPLTNTPGVMGQGAATYIVIDGEDNLKIMLAHLDQISVEKGSTVTAGEVIGTVGNNGYSRHPHIHIGAFKNSSPMQIRFDQSRMLPPQF